jgi:hypothetical protein
MHVVPNPSNGQVLIYLPNTAATLELRVQDALGRIVWTGESPRGTQQLSLDLGDLAEGTYVLVAEGDQERYVQRLVIQR